MPSERTVTKIMSITFVFIGVFFFVLGLFMIMMMGMMTSLLSAFGAAGEVSNSFGTTLAIGWIFSIITFAAGVFSIITAAMMLSMKGEING